MLHCQWRSFGEKVEHVSFWMACLSFRWEIAALRAFARPSLGILAVVVWSVETKELRLATPTL